VRAAEEAREAAMVNLRPETERADAAEKRLGAITAEIAEEIELQRNARQQLRLQRDEHAEARELAERRRTEAEEAQAAADSERRAEAERRSRAEQRLADATAMVQQHHARIGALQSAHDENLAARKAAEIRLA